MGYLPPRSTQKRSSSIDWKRRALSAMRRRFYFQVLKADFKLKQKWWNNYCILRIGAPGKKEFLCQETFYVACMSKESDAKKFREYWYWCKRKSLEILIWLWNLPAENYSWSLHVCLLGLIVTKRPILSEIQRYESKTSQEIAFQIFREWGTFIHRGAN